MKKNLPKLFEIHSIFNESKIMWFKTLLIAVILAMSGNVYSQGSEVVVPFNPRTSSYTPNQTIYHVKGDFTMLGNTNLILDGYYSNSDRNNNDNDVIFVDIDNDPSTVNSSSATLVLSEENGATPECSNIIYAGLYWSGRTQRNDYENTWTTGGSTENVYNNNVINNAYTLNISQNGPWSNDNNRTATYTFTPSGGGDAVTFTFTSKRYYEHLHWKYSGDVTVSVGGTPATPINASYLNDSHDNMTANFDTPYIINTGSANIQINSLTKDPDDNYINNSFRVNVTYGGVTLNKQEVLFKATGDTYFTVSATNSNILYPQGDNYDQIYVAYAEVTDYVRQNGTAEYTVANIALREGKDDAGRSGGWGLVVVYENSKMKWRDVSIFDGYGYMKSDGHDAYLPVQGFNTVPSGAVNMKLGMMASEGDISAAGDFFAIQKLQSSDYERLNHSENSTDNFFNSSIYTGNNPRNPNITNNIGMDISMFNIPNADKSIIANGQTSTTFKYGTGGDGYVIYSIAMAVDAYVPEPEATVAIESVNSTPPGTEVLPNDIIEYSLEIRNIGTEDIENGKIIIPIPYTAEYVSSSGAFFQSLNGNHPYYDSGEGATGAIVWEFGDMPLYNPTTTLLGKLTFKLKVTTDCFILANANCSPAVTLDGSISGIGHDSQVAVSNVGFIQGYQTSGSCEGAAIKDPLTMPINASTYVSENCDGNYSTRDFSYCNFGGSNIPFSDVTANFPAGTRFYNEHPVTSSATEYTNSTGFPGTVGKTYYYAVPPGITACYWQFTITVNDITSTPTANNINYCIGDVATPLTATPSDNSYTLFYYTSATDDTPETSITPSTSTVGTTSYWVAEGLSNQCISPNKVKFEVKVNEVDASVTSQTNVDCFGNNTASVTVTATGGTTPYKYKLDNGTFQASGTFGSLAANDYVVTVEDANGCSTTVDVKITQPDAALDASVTSQTNVDCFSNNTASVTVTATGGTTPYKYKLDNGTFQASGTFGSLAANDYVVTVEDANGCSTTVDVKITQPDAALDASVTSQTNVDCFGNNTASVTVTATGGTTPYKYKLDNGTFQASGTFGSLAANDYVVTVEDANGCSTTVDVKITQPDAALDASVTSQTNVDCFSNNTASVTVTATGGTTPYKYKLDNGTFQASGTFGSLAANDYVVTVEDANGCSTTVDVKITQPDAALDASVTSQTNVDCFSNNTASVTVTATGGTTPYKYKLDNGTFQASGTFGSLAANDYVVTVEDANGCSTTVDVKITQPDAALDASVTSQTNVDCFSNNTASVTVTATGGTTPYKYKLDNGTFQASGTFGSLAANDYVVTVEDANGCSTTVDVKITQPDAALDASVTSQTNVDCFSNNTASVTVTATGGTTPYKYKLDNGTFQASGTFGSLAANDYVVTVEDANGCSTTVDVKITQPDAALDASVTSQTNVDCFSNNTASVTVTATGGTTPYKYKLDNGTFQASGTFGSLAANDYVVTVEDANGCSTTVDVKITQPDAALDASVTSQTNVDCFSNNTASVTVTATGGTTPYKYKLDNGTFQASGTFGSLAANDYVVTVEDANGCSTTVDVKITQPDAALDASVTSQTNVDCFSNNTASVTVTATGGTTPYKYKLDNGTFQTSGTFGSLAANDYVVTVEDANGCSTTVDVKITQPDAALDASVTSQTNVDCFSNNTASVTVTATGGTTPYKYKLDNGTFQTSGTFGSLAANDYVVTVEDANGCSTTVDVKITQPDAALDASVTSQTNVDCFSNNTASVTVTATGGTTPYKYKLDNGTFQASGTFGSLAANDYVVTVEDANGCSTTVDVKITQPDAALDASVTSQTNVDCFSNNTASVTVTATGGTTPYKYKLDNGTFQASGTFGSLAANDYVVTVEDANGCSTTVDVKITQPDAALDASVTSQTNVDCFSNNTASVTVTATGGTTPYKYKLDNGTFQASGTFGSLAANDYVVTVEDANGCSTTVDVKITQPDAALDASVTSQTNVDCFSNNTASVTVTATGGTTPYKYKLDNGTFQASGTFGSLAANDYVVTVEDANGCSTTVDVKITQPDAALDASVTSQTNVDCFSNNTASVTVTATGGTTPYKYKLDNGTFQASGTFGSLAANDYVVTVEDANGCSTNVDVKITQPDAALDASVTSQTNVDCFGNNTASVTVTATGGTTPYKYKLDNGTFQASGTFGSLAANDYVVTVEDANGCSTTVDVKITQPDAALDASVTSQTNVDCFGNNTASVTVTATAGTTPYKYKLDNGTFQASGTFGSLAANDYVVTVEDANGCSTTVDVKITQPDAALDASVTSQTNVDCFSNNTASVTVTATGGTTPYKYKLDNGTFQASGTFGSLAANDYVVTVEDANGCSTTVDVKITQPDAALDASVTSQTNVDCFSNNTASVTVTATGGTTPYKYKLDNGTFQASGTFGSLAANDYVVTVEDANGCSTTVDVKITQPDAALDASVTSQTNVDCFSNNTASVTVTATGGTTPYKYKLDNGTFQTSGTFGSLAANDYVVTVEDANGCSTTVDVKITQPDAALDASVTSQTNVDCFSNNTASVTVTATGGTTPYKYKLDNGTFQASGTFGSLAANDYVVTVEDANGCSTTVDVKITQPDAALDASVTSQTNVDCFSNNTASVTVTATGGTTPYKYKLDNGTFQASGTFGSLAANDYVVTVEDANGCSTTVDVKITQPDAALDASVTSQTNVDCFSNNTASVTVTATGGTTPYKYKLDNGTFQASGTFGSLAANDYVVTVEDANGCSTTVDVKITQPDAALDASVTSQTNVDCFSNNTASVTVTATGGTTPYKYKLDNGTFQASGTFGSLAANDYVVTVEDANGCSTTVDVKITQPDAALDASVTSQTNVDCFSNNTASVTVTATGGTTPYKYKLDNGTFQASGTFGSLAANDYVVTVEDANGCSTNVDVKITQPDAALDASVTSQTNVDCFGNNTASVTVTATGGTTPYKYKLDNGTFQASGTFGSLAANDYVVTVEDANGCSTTVDVKITQPDAALDASVTSQTNVDCFGNNTASVTVTATAGTTPYKYKLDNGTFQASGTFGSLAANDYVVTVEDANGCSTTVDVKITQPDAALDASVTSQTNVDCFSNNTASVTVTATGGTTPYKYKLDNGTFQASGTFGSLAANDYVVTVEDANGCSTTVDVKITQPDAALDASVTSQTNVDCFSNNTASVTVTATGGTTPYKYKLDNGTFQASGTFGSLAANDYVVTVEDANGCSTTVDVKITQPDKLTCNANQVSQVTIFGHKDGVAKVTPDGGIEPYEYLWDNGDERATADTLGAGNHEVTVTDANGCETTCQVTIGQPGELTCDVDLILNVDCNGSANGAAKVTAKGGVGSYYYLWDNGDTRSTADTLRVGTHTVMVTDDNGAETKCEVTINEPDEVILIVPTDSTVASCLTQQEVDAEFAIWLSRAKATGGNSLVLTNNNTGAPLACGGTVTVTWTASSECPDDVQYAAKFTVTTDNEKPTFTVPADITIAKAADCSYNASVEVTGDVTDEVDNCDTKPNATFSDEVANGDCEGKLIITRTWTLTDDCGNSTEHVQTITVEDQTAPTFNETLPTAEITAECDNVVEAVVLTASDNCDSEVPVVFTETRTDGDCANNYTLTRTWTASDDCGNETSFTQTVVVSDNTAPEITCNDITVQLDANGSATITVDDINGGTTDACSDIDTMYISQATFNCDNVGENEVTLTVIDECGNASTCTATVTVEEGDANCGLQPFKANDDILTLVYCPDETISGELDLFANDEGFTPENVNFTILTDLPEGVSVTDGNLLYANENPAEAVITFTYSVCHTVNTENCSTAKVTIQLLVDTDCDDVPDIDDLDDDDDGILDIIEEENALDQTSLDSDGDGIVDRLDIDADNDGIVDNVEWQSTIAEGGEYDYIFPLGTDSNGDGWDDAYDPASNGITYEPWDMDLDGTPDYLDTNTDNEGEDDNVEGWDEFPNDSIADVSYIGSDADKDGLDDAYDTYNTTTEEWAPGQNAIGSDAYLQDTDNDGVRDWRDAVDDRTPPELFACGDPVIPNAFSPNQDGYNDYFKVMIYCTGTQGGNEERVLGDDFSDARIEIFNRWGTLVYEQERYGDEDYWGDVDAWWNGTSMNNMQVGGNQLPTATYYYILYFNDGNREPITGFVFLNN